MNVTLSYILLSLGFMINESGCKYIIKLIDLIQQRQEILIEPNYKIVAKSCGVSEKTVYNSVRKSIEFAHRSGKLSNINKYLGRNVYREDLIFLNSEFIYMIIEIMYNNSFFEKNNIIDKMS